MYRIKVVWFGSALLLMLGAGSCARTQTRSGEENLLATGLVGWQQVAGERGSWKFEDGVLYTDGRGGGWLATVREYDDFRLHLEFRIGPEGNSGVFVRAPQEGDPAYGGMEIQILDDHAEAYGELRPDQYTGSIYGVQAPAERASKEAGQWQAMVIECCGPRVKVVLNGEAVIDTSTEFYPYVYDTHPGLNRRSGYIGLQNHGGRIEFRNIKVWPLPDGACAAL